MKCQPTGSLPEVLSDADRAVLFDAECVVCSAWVHFLLRWDTRGVLRLGAVQSEAGRALLAYAGLPTEEIDTMLYVDRGVPYTRSSAALRVAGQLAFPFSLATVGLVVPTFLRDWLYDRLAKNRYSLFGKKELCLIPSPEQRARFL